MGMMSDVTSDQPEKPLYNKILGLVLNASASIITKNTSSVERWNTQVDEENSVLVNAIVICFYALIIIVSFFGNLIVCKIVFTGSSKKSTTNLYIGNLSVSDLIMTIINIPLQLTHVLMRNWPLGFLLCKFLPLFGGMSVTASTLTMAFIALDRYKVIAHPLKPRASYKTTIFKIVVIWFIAFILSFPYSLMSQLTTYPLTSNSPTRCTIEYPSPMYRQIFTLMALVLYFAGPLSISAVTYVKICLIIWNRKSIGAVRVDQQTKQRKAKWKTIKMLIIVLVTFIVCWLPLNIYHTYQDARDEEKFWKHKSAVWFVCHWFAMSSVCCNPFIYCWLNDKFRKVAKSKLLWIFTVIKTKSSAPESLFLTRNHNRRFNIFRNTSSSLKFSTFSTQSKDFQSGGLSRQTSRNDSESKLTFQHAVVAKTSHGESKQIFQHAIVGKTNDHTICIFKESPKQSVSIEERKHSNEKNSTTPESFV